MATVVATVITNNLQKFNRQIVLPADLPALPFVLRHSKTAFQTHSSVDSLCFASEDLRK